MPAHEIVIPDSYKNATFEDFKSFIDNQPTYSTPEIVKILKKWTT
jgi:hypothetical protein